MVNPFFAAHAKPIIKKQPMSSNIIKTPTGVRRTNPLAPGPAEYTKSLHSALNNNSNFPDEAPVKENIGKIGLMWPRKEALEHDAAPLLLQYASKGCPVECGPDWTNEHIKLALMKGPHASAKSKAAIAALRQETLDKVKNNYARVIRWSDIKHNVPQQLKLSPVAMIPHKSRSFRCILDLSFRLRYKGKTLSSVNSETTKLAPAQSMAQLGSVLKRIVALLADHRTSGTIFQFSKLDIKDGFWRLAVNDTDAWNFCYVLPQQDKPRNIDDIEIVVPNCLQMGWCESPPFFCASSETARDIIQTLLTKNDLPPHQLETLMLPDTLPNVAPLFSNKTCSTLIEVYMDDYIGATNDPTMYHLKKVSRAMLHGVHSIYPPPIVSGHSGEDPVSAKKLGSGEGRWQPVKEILGWIVDGKNYTLQLPPTKCKNICTLIRKILKQAYCPIKRFQVLAGKLQHASFGLPGGTGLFSPLQLAMVGNPTEVKLTPSLQHALRDWRTIVQHLAAHPTSVGLLVPSNPNFLEYIDACRLGAGGVITPGLSLIQHTVWQTEWPEAIRIRFDAGLITINDLELAALVLGWLVMEKITSVTFKHVAIFCDNTSAVSWAAKLRTSKSIPAARLLRLLGLRIRTMQASSLVPMRIAGSDNTMADIASRAFNDGKFFHAHNDLTQYFNSHFPLPQQASWTVFQITKRMLLPVISCLLGEQSPMESLIRQINPTKNIGGTGVHTVRHSILTPSCAQEPNYSNKSLSQVSLQGSGQVFMDTAIKSKFSQSLMRLRPSPRPSNWLDNKAPSTKPTMSTNFR